MNEAVREKLSLLPTAPGVYLMKDSTGTVLYVGKATVLRNRVRSYFSGSHDRKTQSLVARIADFEYIVTDTVVEALLLECNLIKQFTPHYNIMLRDDKAYPYIKITGERHPRLEIVRRLMPDGGKYFGPYPNATSASETKRLLEKLYPLRKCKVLKPKVCLYYHIGQCLAPCEFTVAEDTWSDIVKQIASFLNGGHRSVIASLRQRMEMEADALRFERAKELRDLMQHIEKVMEEQKVNVADQVDRDVFGFHADMGRLCMQVFHVRAGKLIQRSVSIMEHHGEPLADAMSWIEQFYWQGADVPSEILLPAGTQSDALAAWLNARCLHPQRGPKRHLVDLACKNASTALEDRLRLMERDMDRSQGAVTQLGDVLAIPAPMRIEAFDNSNLQGVDAVAAMVVFRNGKPDGREYRKYRIRTVQGADDYASIKEVIRRRYTRLLKEQGLLPDLIVIDGGKGQVAAALDVLENELDLDIPVVGLAKNDRHQTQQVFFRYEEQPVELDKHSQAFYLLMRIQEEVHRFALSFHRQTRRKRGLASILEQIPGVGPQRRKALLRKFGSIDAIRCADDASFREVGIGPALAGDIREELDKSMKAVVDSPSG